MTLTRYIAAADLESAISANIRRHWEAYHAQTGERQDRTAKKMFPWLAPKPAARQLRRLMDDSGAFPAKARLVIGVAQVLGVQPWELYLPLNK